MGRSLDISKDNFSPFWTGTCQVAGIDPARAPIVRLCDRSAARDTWIPTAEGAVALKFRHR